MDKQEYQLWAAQIPTLTKEQRDEALIRFKLISKGVVKEHNGKQDVGERILQAICTVMKKNNVDCPSVLTLKKSAAYGQSKEKFNDLQTYIEYLSKSKLIQDSILREAISLLYHDLLQWQGVAVSSHLILRQVHRIPAVVNKSFPGYAASGLLSMIVKGS